MEEDPVDTLWDSSCELLSDGFRCHTKQRMNLLPNCSGKHFSSHSYDPLLCCPSMCGCHFVSDSPLQRLPPSQLYYCAAHKTKKILPRSCRGRPFRNSIISQWLPWILSGRGMSRMLVIVFLVMGFPNIVLGVCDGWWCENNATACSNAGSEPMFCNCTFQGLYGNDSTTICLGVNDTNSSCGGDICSVWNTCLTDSSLSPPSCQCSGYNETACSSLASMSTESPLMSSAHPPTTLAVATTSITTSSNTATTATVTTQSFVDVCDLLSPCRNNGTCHINTSEHYYCNCTAQFTGVNCTVPTNACNSNPCANNGTCSNTDVGSGYSCSCGTGYNGTKCEYATCVGVECQHGAMCIVVGNDTKWECNCSSHLEGNLCESTKPCNRSLCSYQGDCRYNFDGSPNCTCFNGYTDRDCSRMTNISVCDSSPCLHGGTCIADNSSASYTCHCAPEYFGPNCTIFDQCSIHPCKNNATCLTHVNGTYLCNCTENYAGPNCTDIVDACISLPCQNNGTCNYTSDKTISCTCLPGYYGDHCQSYDACYSQPCRNGGSCSTSSQAAGYNCSCPTGFTGSECENTEKVPSGSDTPVGLIVGLTVGLTCAVLLVIAMVIFIKYAQSKRAKHGTYHPSQQEMAGSRLDFSNAIKPPPEERLI